VSRALTEFEAKLEFNIKSHRQSKPGTGCDQRGTRREGAWGVSEARQNKGPTMALPLDGHYSNMRGETHLVKSQGKAGGKSGNKIKTKGTRLSQPPNVTRTLQVSVSTGERGQGARGIREARR